jgi:hypothetical protein
MTIATPFTLAALLPLLQQPAHPAGQDHALVARSRLGGLLGMITSWWPDHALVACWA